MGNQGRNEFETRNIQGTAGTTGTTSTTEYGGAAAQARPGAGVRPDERRGFFHRAEGRRGDPYTVYGSEYDSTPSASGYGHPGSGPYGTEFDRARAGVMEDERAVRARREEEGRQWRERHPADFGRATQGGYFREENRGANYGRGYNQTLGRTEEYGRGYGYGSTMGSRENFAGREYFGRENTGSAGSMAYGDYGHPTEEGRSAYGDMGFGGTRETWQRGTMRGVAGATGAQVASGLGMDAAAASRNRRWRRGGQTARDVMTRNPKTARPDDTLQSIAQIMVDEDTGIVPIVEDGNRLVGVVTDRDIVCRLLARGVDLRAAKARDAMTDEVECVTEDSQLHTVLSVMGDHQIRRLPVVARGDRLVGILSIGDIAREADVNEDLQDAFEEISSQRGFWSRLR